MSNGESGAARDDASLVEDAEWKSILTTGHGWPRGVRAVFQRIPRGPRCKVCATPFGGLGGKITGLAGFKPSRKNPFICGRCIDSMQPGGATVDVAILFADVRGSTGLGEALDSASYAARLNRFYAVATRILLSHDAIIDKLIGDEVMALFLPGIAGPDYRRRACEAGLELVEAMADRTGTAHLPIGVAVHAGLAYVGNVGGKGIVDFTALGDTVNTASRLQSFARPGDLVLSEAVMDPQDSLLAGTIRRKVEIRGRTEPVDILVLSR